MISFCKVESSKYFTFTCCVAPTLAPFTFAFKLKYIVGLREVEGPWSILSNEINGVLRGTAVIYEGYGHKKGGTPEAGHTVHSYPPYFFTLRL